eukprot:CAMPEP_0202727654 /NCGR_PEP_ID=MMETSP1385-20130828/185229_1 /ASSEMBLY_ACC=CAM_ASM_000861 /TAXON_ID=933848 /ORGANISM="Elphidium margaritaceum" /LENGTH=1104 /DNA_ID=CAMNT_0049393897 /DNA_START=33 /DNA_END=3348 /DNA_ORIENTATION=-
MSSSTALLSYVILILCASFHFAFIAGETIIAQANEYVDQDLYCASNQACVVYCKEESSCHNTTIYCPVNELCVVSCGQHSNACNGVTIDARYSSLLELTDCASGDDTTCASMSVYAPPNDNGDKRAILAIGDSFKHDITLYAVFGWRDIDMSRFTGQYTQIEGEMFCSYEYDAHCVLDQNQWQCENANHECNDANNSSSVQQTAVDGTTTTTSTVTIVDTVLGNDAKDDDAGSFASDVQSLLHALDTSWYMAVAFIVLICCCTCLVVTCLYRRVSTNFASAVQHKLDRQKNELQEIRSMIEQSSNATATMTAKTTYSSMPSQDHEFPRAGVIQQQRSDTNTFEERDEENLAPIPSPSTGPLPPQPCAHRCCHAHAHAHAHTYGAGAGAGEHGADRTDTNTFEERDEENLAPIPSPSTGPLPPQPCTQYRPCAHRCCHTHAHAHTYGAGAGEHGADRRRPLQHDSSDSSSPYSAYSDCDDFNVETSRTYQLPLQRNSQFLARMHPSSVHMTQVTRTKISDLHSKSTPARAHAHVVDSNATRKMKLRSQMTPSELVKAIHQDVVMEQEQEQNQNQEQEEQQHHDECDHMTQVSLTSHGEYYKNVAFQPPENVVFQPPAIKPTTHAKIHESGGGGGDGNQRVSRLELAADRDTMSTTSKSGKPSDTLDVTELSQLSDLTSHHHSDTSSINWESLEFTFSESQPPVVGGGNGGGDDSYNNLQLQAPAPPPSQRSTERSQRSMRSSNHLGAAFDSNSRQSSTAQLSTVTASSEPKYRLKITCHDSVNTSTTATTMQPTLSTVTSSQSTKSMESAKSMKSSKSSHSMKSASEYGDSSQSTKSMESAKSMKSSKSSHSMKSAKSKSGKSDKRIQGKPPPQMSRSQNEASLEMNGSSTELDHLTTSKATNTNRTASASKSSTSLSSEPTPAETAQPATERNKPKLSNNSSNSTMKSTVDTDDGRVDAISVQDEEEEEEDAATESAFVTVNSIDSEDDEDEEDEDEDEDEDGIVDLVIGSDTNPKSPSRPHQLEQQHEEEPLELATAGSGSSASEPSDIGSSVQSQTASVLSSMVEGDLDENSGSHPSSWMEDLATNSSNKSCLPIYEEREKQ